MICRTAAFLLFDKGWKIYQLTYWIKYMAIIILKIYEPIRNSTKECYVLPFFLPFFFLLAASLFLLHLSIHWHVELSSEISKHKKKKLFIYRKILINRKSFLKTNIPLNMNLVKIFSIHLIVFESSHLMI